MKYFLPLFCLLCINLVTAQQKSFVLKGQLTAVDTKAPLESATVYLERVKDSSLVTYTISDKDGLFQLEDRTYDDNLNLFISYIGYKAYKKTVSIDRELIDLGTIEMQVDDNALDEVVIKSRAPITIKKDTLEFNVKSFKTKKDASVEDLLKQLPGVEVDDEGNITVNGKSVNKILVNGKPFFGNDPTITTRNLTKELIEKVQITDTKTKSEAFAGEEGDDENKTINLTIKEENNKGVFGRVSAGGGTDERYEFAGLVNYFDNDRRISVLGGGNNINSPGFSFGEIQKMFGNVSSISINSNGNFSINGRSFGGGGDGIVTSRSTGANYADELSKGVDVASDYFYSKSNSENESTTERETILPDSRFFTNSNIRTTSDNDNHRFNTEFDIEVDSTFLINIRPSFNYGNSISQNNRFEETLDENQVKSNQTTFSSFNESFVKNFQNDLDITKRLDSNGSFLKFGFQVEFNRDESENFQRSETLINDPDQDDITRDQFLDDDASFDRYRLSATYRIPIISKTLFLDTELSYVSEVRNSVNSAFDFNDATLEYDLFNADLSSDFKFRNLRTTPKLSVRYNKDKFGIGFGVGYVMRTIENEDGLRPEFDIKRNFRALEFNGNTNYRFSDKSSMYSSFSYTNTPPQLRQLQAFQDVSNPLNIVTGNPNLSPSNNFRMFGGFNSFDWQKRTGFFGNINASFTRDQIVTRTIVDENFVRNTTYENVNGNYNVGVNGSFRKSVKLDSTKTLKYRIGGNINSNKRINFNNDVKYSAKNTSVGPSVGLTLDWKKVLEIAPTYRLNYTNSTFDIAQFEDQSFVTHNVGIRTATFVPKKLEWRNDINFNYNPNVAPGFQKSAWFWNSTLAYSMLKDKGTLTLKAYDLLNQNTNARRTITADYIQDSESTVLRRYFMLSFSWKFNSLGPKGSTNDSSFIILD
ncbi:outer membrane beta-barrel protein [Winogradskyella maritima]|uniref:Outer membrane beta-barrel protein n=1 Tax=Winogradskyella maritima TaxID=1517766 RepID=A0ABV8AGC4_9FLAO|nr:outer membrane beta-barrel protein [Winogradskyella maritima]